MDKKIIFGIIFIILVIVSSLLFVFIGGDTIDDEPNIIVDDELDKNDVVHNIHEQKNSIESYRVNKQIRLTPTDSEGNSLSVDSDRSYYNELTESLRETDVQVNGESHHVRQYNYNGSEYLYVEESNAWNTRQSIAQTQLFEYSDIVDEQNIDSYTFDERDNSYIFTTDGSHADNHAQQVLRNILNDNEIDKTDMDFRLNSVQDTTYTVVVDDSDFIVTEINIETTANIDGYEYDVDIDISDIEPDIDAITLPEELSSTENIEIEMYFNYLNISQTTTNGVQIEIVEDVSDIVEHIRVETEYTTIDMNGAQGETLTLEPNADFNPQAPNIKISAHMNNGDIMLSGEYKLAQTIELEDEEE